MGIQHHLELINSFLLVDRLKLRKGIMDPSEVNSRSYFIVSSHMWTGSCRGTCAVNGGSGEPLAIVTVFIRCSTSLSTSYSLFIPDIFVCVQHHAFISCVCARQCPASAGGGCVMDITQEITFCFFTAYNPLGLAAQAATRIWR